jgi:hypothetical protein
LRLSPVAAWHELRHPEPIAGHSAAATLSVIAMLAVLAVQVITGLFATDGSFTEGPWARYASHATVATLTSVHAVNRWLVLTLVALHVAAIAVYAVRRDPLVGAIWHGNRAGLPAGTPAAEDDARLRLRAAIFAALAIALTAYLTSPSRITSRGKRRGRRRRFSRWHQTACAARPDCRFSRPRSVFTVSACMSAANCLNFACSCHSAGFARDSSKSLPGVNAS